MIQPIFALLACVLAADPAGGIPRFEHHVIDSVGRALGHAQEQSLLPQVLPTVQEQNLWIADRNFCTTGFLFGIAVRHAAFIIRQHRQTLRYELLGERRRA